MAAQFLPFEHDEPAAPPVGTLVCIPGLNSGSYMFTGARAALPRWRIVRFNTPGLPGVPLPLPFTVHTYAEHVRRHLGLVQLGQQPVVVMGHSLGGYAAQELARIWPSMVAKLVLVATSRGQPDTARDMKGLEAHIGQNFWAWSRQLENDPATALKPLFGPDFPLRQPEVYHTFLALRAAFMPDKSATLAQITAGGIFSSARWAKHLPQPALVIHGTADTLISFKSGQQLAATLPHGRLLALHEVGHFPPLEHPKFWEYVAEFCEGVKLGDDIAPTPNFWTYLKRFWGPR
ncbi:MAG: alpha/beta fold hydrolase [Pseudomonadota bacterium]|jgi:pimeloyl-ACP methyl ester carboxylesterase